MNELEPKRTLEGIAAEIRTFTASMLNNVIEIGRRMCEAKEMVPYGQWGAWIRENTGYSVSTADNFMRLFQEYGADQGCLFGAQVDSQTFGKLSYSKALALLAVPKSEREAFVEEVDAEHLSTRELKAAIAERDEAIRRAEKAEKELLSIEDGHGLAMAELEEKLDRAREEAEKGKRAQEILRSAQDDKDALERQLSAARDTIRELESRPVEVAVQRDEEAIREAEKLATAKADAEWGEKLDKLQKKLDKAEKEKAKAEDAAKAAGEENSQAVREAERELEKTRAELAEARKQLKASNGNVAAFGVLFRAVQEDINRMLDKLLEIAENDDETAGKLRLGARTILTQTLERLGG